MYDEPLHLPALDVDPKPVTGAMIGAGSEFSIVFAWIVVAHASLSGMPSSFHFARATIEACRQRWANIQRLVDLSECHEMSRHMEGGDRPHAHIVATGRANQRGDPLWMGDNDFDNTRDRAHERTREQERARRLDRGRDQKRRHERERDREKDRDRGYGLW